jgi:hypothetical protein
VIILGAFDAQPVELCVEPTHALEDGDLPRGAERLADGLGFHERKLLHERRKVKKKFADLIVPELFRGKSSGLRTGAAELPGQGRSQVQLGNEGTL